MTITKKAGSTLQPLIVIVDIPTEVPITSNAIEEVRLLLRRAYGGPTVLNEEIVQGADSTDWSLDSDGKAIEVTWYEDPDELLAPGLYEGEIWITDVDARVLKAPSKRHFNLNVKRSIAPVGG